MSTAKTKPTDATEVLDNAIAERQATMPQPISDAPHQALMQNEAKAFACNFQGNQLEMFHHISNAKNGEHKKLLDAVGQTLELELWYAHEVEFVNNDGEVIEAKRTVLFDKSGDSYECVSNGVFDFLSSAVAVFGYKPWSPPLKVQVVLKQTRHWRMLTLLPVPIKKN